MVHYEAVHIYSKKLADFEAILSIGLFIKNYSLFLYVGFLSTYQTQMVWAFYYVFKILVKKENNFKTLVEINELAFII